MFFEPLSKFHDRVAFIEENARTYTYAQLLEFGNIVADSVRSRSLLFFVGLNSASSISGYIGFLQKGVVPLLFRHSISQEHFRNLLSVYKPEYLFIPSSRKDLAEGTEPLIEAEGYRLCELKEGIHSELHPDLSLVLTTSGSTGSPKLVRLSGKNIRSNAEAIIDYLGITSNDRAITTLPMAYSYGLSIIHSHLLAGATLVLTDAGLMERRFWDLFKAAKPTTFGGVPYTYEMLKRLRFDKLPLPSLRYLTQAGGRLSPELVGEFASICERKGIRFVVMYGQTEATARMAYLPWEKASLKPSSIGMPIPGGSFSLIDDSGNAIEGADISGELVYRGPNVSLGYAETRNDLAKGDENKGVLHTGDIATRDHDGFYYIVGRKKRFLKIFGNRVNLDEIELLIRERGIEAACAGKDDLMKVYLTDSQKREEVISLLAKTTDLNPAAFEIRVIDVIPRDSSGKVLYSLLERELP